MELPRLEPLWQKYRDQGLTILAVETERDTERALEFIAESNLTYPMLEDLEGDESIMESRLQMYGQPASYLVDRSGRIMFSHLGFEAGDEVRLEEEIQKLLNS